MAKNEYTPKQFTPFIYPEWGELFEDCTDEKKAEYLMAIVKYPNVQIDNDPVWRFIKSQLDKDYETFTTKCLKKGEASRNYWANKRNQQISNDNQLISNDNQMISNDTNRQPKLLTSNLNSNSNSLLFIKPTKKEIEEYCKLIAKRIDIDEFIAYYDASNWEDKSGLPINWKQKVLKFAQNYKPKEQPTNEPTARHDMDDEIAEYLRTRYQ